MNAEKYKILISVLLALISFQTAFADSAALSTKQGNQLYEQGKFDQAIKQYDQALIDSPQALEPKFNKANSYYRLDDLDHAMDLYRQVASESKDMKLVSQAKYNLGNSWFQQGSKQRDSNLKKAVDNMESAIENWRGVLDIDPENQKAAKNIEVARLTIKDILDQIKKQQQKHDPNQPQKQKHDPNQPQDPNQAQKQKQQSQSQQGQQDPNKPKDPNQQKQQGAGAEPNQPQQSSQQQQQQAQKKDQEQKQKQKSDAIAQKILDKEQRDKKQRQRLQRAPYQKVEKDW